MNNFFLQNSCSINLNFLIYIHNLYENYHKSHKTSKFPWLPLKETALLDYKEMNMKARNLWTAIFDSYDMNDRVDLEWWINNKFHYYDLFKIDHAGMKLYEDIKKSFESWYWGIGKHMCDIFSHDLVENYYKELVVMTEKKDLQLKNTTFYLQVVYNAPPVSWKNKNEKMIIISPETKRPTVDELYDALFN